LIAPFKVQMLNSGPVFRAIHDIPADV
jgi:hypothetical protein